ncbi:Membrane transport protein mmpL8 [Actinomyces bovis]|uniref:Membrane transport protein mmpL8 n=1 Tax=Actinomyces bovis TaxID=1658 RepID=A0ABY1VQY9_9ACTO|nr:MMPL family transporter [Actinomyces bovis]SPT54066.1 Membrane transport protein mmpL8 [Actinomyces bovis]VEG53746.1 Membrane transport protein mmpL8 [Actinomyces israelii]
MLSWLSRRIVKDAWYIVGVWAAVAAILATLSLVGLGGGSLFDRLKAGDGLVTGSSSAEGQQVLDSLSGDGVPVTLLVTGVDIKSEEQQKQVAQALTQAHADLRELVGETNVVDPFVVPGMLSEHAAQALASSKLDGFLIVAKVDPNGPEVAKAEDAKHAKEVERLVAKVTERMRQVPGELAAVAPQAKGIVSHADLMTAALNNQVQQDLVHGEVVSLPLALVVMVLVFGGFLLAGMPLAGALVSIGCSLGALFLLSHAMDLQSFVVNIVSVIGLGLSIDYGLLITSRFREELKRAQEGASKAGQQQSRRRHGPVPDALEVTLATAGRTVLFSALTVAICLLGLLLLRPAVLRLIGLAGVAVVLAAVVVSLTLVPALLSIAGTRLLQPSPLARIPGLGALQARLGDVSREEGVFSAIARRVHQHPWVVLVSCLVLLVLMAAPVSHLHMLSSKEELLPPNSDQRAYLNTLAENYPAAQAPDATVVLAGSGESVLGFVNDSVSKAEGVNAVLQTATAGRYTVLYLDLQGDPGSTTAEQAVQALRATTPPVPMWVTGQAASQVDFHDAVLRGAPVAGLVIVLATFVLLFLMTGSLLVPVKALIINVISLLASLGLLTWVFQDGYGSGLLGFTPIGGLETYVVITAVAVGFGLAMDYEVFLLSRIKEFWDLGEDNDTAVERGLQRSGRIVTSAALIMVLVFVGFVSGQLLVVKQIGLAMAIIVALDATLVRMLLVPATMTLLGEWNWWAPAPLRKLHARIALAH